MKRPLAAVVSFYTFGLLLPGIFPVSLAVLFVVSFLVLGVVLFFEKLRWPLVWPLLVLAGWTNLVFHTAPLSPDDLRHLVGKDPAIATVRGSLAETPRIKIVG